MIGEGFTSTTAWKPKNDFFFFFFLKEEAYLSVSAVMFCKQFLDYAVHIDILLSRAIHKH